MSFTDMIKKSVLEGFNYTDFSAVDIIIALVGTFIIALYIFAVYRYVCRSAFYNKNFAISMAIISVVTAGIILAMQSNLVISLGMVGALSIVRFRTAIKDPLDLLFLFWSIGTGIIMGANLYELAIILALIVTAGLFILQVLPAQQSPQLLVVKYTDRAVEQQIYDIFDSNAVKYKVDSKSVTKMGTTMIIEVRTKAGDALVDAISAISGDGVTMVTLMQHEGEVKY